MILKSCIIGGGVAGLADARYLLEKLGDSLELILLDHRLAQAASDDISKVVRPDYANVSRMREAIHAQKGWKDDELLKPFYWQVGRIVMYDESEVPTLVGIEQTRSQLGLEKRTRPDKTTLENYYGASQNSTNSTFVYNNDDALVDWKGCMQAVRERIQTLCLNSKTSKVLETPAQELEHGGGRITAVICGDGSKIDTSDVEVIVAAGAWTAELLENSSINLPPISRAPVATGIFAIIIQLNEKQKKHFWGKPGFSHIGCAEFLPPTTDDGKAKITSVSSFTNVGSGSTLSYARDLSRSNLAILRMLEMKDWALEYIPALKGAKITDLLSYWDGMTPTQHPVTTRHPEYENLILDTGFSYTRAKDFPTHGEEVANVIYGTPINPNYGWLPHTESSHQDQLHLDQPRLLARGNFEDLELKAGKDPRVQAWKDNQAPENDFLEEI